MDTNSSVKVLLGGTFQNERGKSLSNLTSMRPNIMETENSLSLSLVDN